MDLGETIKHYRRKKGLTQAQLAELANTDNCHVNRIENGHKMPSIPMLQGISAVLDVPAWVLLYGKMSASAQEALAILEGCAEWEQAELCANLAAMMIHMRRFR